MFPSSRFHGELDYEISLLQPLRAPVKMTATHKILCTKWGAKYGPEYVNRLYAMVARNITLPFRFICLTDSRAGIRPEVECLDLPELGCAQPVRTFGQWRKVVLWGKDLCGLSGVALFIDLDSVIVGNIDPYFTFGDADDVVLARNWARPLRRLGQTSVFRFPIGRNSHILDDFRADPQGVADRFRFEQHYMTHAVRGGVKFWPTEWTKHFRIHCLGPLPMRYLRTARFPEGARIVTFPGGPNPGDVIDGRWTPEAPRYRGAWAHFMATFSSRRGTRSRWTHLKSFVRPCGWVRDLWQE